MGSYACKVPCQHDTEITFKDGTTYKTRFSATDVIKLHFDHGIYLPKHF